MSLKIKQLKELKELLDEGGISLEEYESLKQEVLKGTSTSPEPNVNSELSKLGSYQIKYLLGEGGQGSVYVGRHRIEGKALEQGGDVAIKILHSENQEMMDRLEAEAMMGIQLNHPNIVKVYDFVIDGDTVGIVMEKVVGIDLSKVLYNRGQPIPWEEVRSWSIQIGQALEYAHQNGIVHRDIKPENIMLKGDGSIKILDFGIAKKVNKGGASKGRTKTGVGMGTIAYMAPEQYTDAKYVDRRADIYAFGMVLYELLSGRLPWDGSKCTDFEILKRKERGDIIPFSEVYFDNQKLSKVIERCLKTEQENRYENIGEVVHIIESLNPDIESVKEEHNIEEKAIQEIPSTEIPHLDLEEGWIEKEVPSSESSNETVSNISEIMTEHNQVHASVESTNNKPTEKVADIVADEHQQLNASGKGVWYAMGLVILGLAFIFLSQDKSNQEKESKTVSKESVEDDNTKELDRRLKLVELEKQKKEKRMQIEKDMVSKGFVLIPGESFTMGCTPEQGRCATNEKPSHSVTITKDFFIGKYEVTQELYSQVTGKNPSHFRKCGKECPVENVSWNDAITFLNKLSDRDGFERCYQSKNQFIGLDCEGYRLPTEAEWEFAARGSDNFRYSGSDKVNDVAWYIGNSGKKTHAVGQKNPNRFGLYDMSGNVWEWVWDTLGPYSKDISEDPLGGSQSINRVLRGGSWQDGMGNTRIAFRGDFYPTGKRERFGFRICRTLPISQ